ncbi:MAG TPA: serine/threonine-protein kinase [Usitatibacter sp.]|jgi:serine/threonine-protein kinase|nr:serine/threonine-protein kinase [Usitatibacter sp.]
MAGEPEAIGKYRLMRALGRGGMGMVYEGFDPGIERRVAIKTILADQLDPSEMEEAVARFRREAQAGGRLQHPNIVSVYEFGQQGAMSYIVMEYAEGEELKRLLARGRLAPIDVFEIMKQLLMALDYSHRQGVVHRDIKPANLMIQPGPRVKVMDFGIARIATSSLTQLGTVVGTPTHMAPEQLAGMPVDGRADLWASGVILYELLTGVSPFHADSPATVMHRVLQGEVPPPTSLDASIAPAFDAVIGRALRKHAGERFQTAREFQLAMLHAMQGRDPAPPRAARSALALPPEASARIENALARHIGPLARVIMKRGISRAASVGELVRTLALDIPDEAEQRDFLQELHGFLEAPSTRAPPAAPTTGPHAAAAFTPEMLERAERSLASFVGPLARVLIREAAHHSGNVKELYARLAAHIDSEEERRAFLESLGR